MVHRYKQISLYTYKKKCMCMPPAFFISFIDYGEDCINYKITFTVFFLLTYKLLVDEVIPIVAYSVCMRHRYFNLFPIFWATYNTLSLP